MLPPLVSKTYPLSYFCFETFRNAITFLTRCEIDILRWRRLTGCLHVHNYMPRLGNNCSTF